MAVFSRRISSYGFSSDGIIVRHVLHKSLIPWERICGASATQYPFHGATRTFGVGGLFGYHGYFKKEGRTIVGYATRSNNCVVIRGKDKDYVLTPADTSKFLEEIVRRLESKPE